MRIDVWVMLDTRLLRRVGNEATGCEPSGGIHATCRIAAPYFWHGS
jgi:hypothetical protein